MSLRACAFSQPANTFFASEGGEKIMLVTGSQFHSVG
jgi:hypothetical protein